jgi:choline-phosphate cytidylyltransferase
VPTSSHPTLPTPADIQQFIKNAIRREGELGKVRKYRINEPPEGRPVRIYADGR